jgi:addiction module RelE/StbE family toxin
MQYVLSKQFEKDFAKLSKPLKKKVLVTLQIFIQDPLDSRLRNHRLHGRWHNHHSINVTGDVRAIYVYVENNTVYFITLGTHSELYG